MSTVDVSTIPSYKDCTPEQRKKEVEQFRQDFCNYMVDYGQCCGTVKNGKVFTMPHTYRDGKMHGYCSDGLCPDCYRISELLRFQRKINALEEKLNGLKAEGLEKSGINKKL